MARPTNKLSAQEVKFEARPGRHSDGGGLYLQVEPGGSKSWVFMWKRDGKRTAMGLGRYPDNGLGDARGKAEAARKNLAAGRDPLLQVRQEAEREEADKTFSECVDLFLDEDRKASWRNSKHRAQWEMTLGDAYCKHLRPMRVSTIGTEDVLKVLKPIWSAKPETASRLRGRIERVLSFAKGKGWRSGENPALWRGHLDSILPKPEKLKRRGHHRAMAYGSVPAFMQRLREASGMDAKALEFTILTAARSGETVGATWDEIDFEQKVWTVPASRIKAGRRHEVPLSPRAVALLRLVPKRNDNPYVFPGQRKGKPISAASMEMLLRRWELKDQTTIHGFRSSFRDWVGDCTDFPREVAEAALAHVIGDKAEQAYRRGTALERRRKLMTAWADFLASGDGKDKVIPLDGRRKVARK
ncbi:integrase arm-type DNA-binding domain-containing protein [Mesorhizobium sp. M1338]|uniref:tyrosine-type recombinase/integrase n=1 Tax=unclassified Mesorhizobium TaxID=325217 RepID=UPI003339DB17